MRDKIGDFTLVKREESPGPVGGEPAWPPGLLGISERAGEPWRAWCFDVFKRSLAMSGEIADSVKTQSTWRKYEQLPGSIASGSLARVRKQRIW